MTHLSLQASAFGSEGTVALAEGLSSPSTATSLEALDLSSNGIGNDGDRRAPNAALGLSRFVQSVVIINTLSFPPSLYWTPIDRNYDGRQLL